MNRLTTAEVAARLGVGKSTVNLWCNQGKFPNAEHVEETRGPVWYIPESDLTNFVKPTPGRPPKQATAAPPTTKSEIRSADMTTQKLNQAFRKATEDEQQTGKKKGKK